MEEPTFSGIRVTNPLDREFEATYDFGKNGIVYKLPAKSSKVYEPVVGRHIARELAYEIIKASPTGFKGVINQTLVESEMAKIMQSLSFDNDEADVKAPEVAETKATKEFGGINDDYENMGWNELRATAKDKGIELKNKNADTLVKELQSL